MGASTVPTPDRIDGDPVNQSDPDGHKFLCERGEGDCQQIYRAYGHAQEAAARAAAESYAEAEHAAVLDAYNKLVAVLGAAGDAGLAARESVRRAAQTLRSTDDIDPALKSAVARILQALGSKTRFAANPLFRDSAHALQVLGVLTDIATYAAEGKSIVEIGVRTGLNAGGAIAGGAVSGVAVGAGCEAVTAGETAGLSTPGCVVAGAVAELLGGIGGGIAAQYVGGKLFDSDHGVVVVGRIPIAGVGGVQPTPGPDTVYYRPPGAGQPSSSTPMPQPEPEPSPQP